MPSNDGHPLTPLVRKAADILGDIHSRLTEIRDRLDELTTTVQKGFEQVDESIQKQTEAQAELKLMEHMAEVTSIKPQIRAERQQIEDEKSELDETLGTISERYQERHDELDRRAEERIRDLGEHIFRIDEEEFEAGIEDPFTEYVTTTWHDLQDHNQRTMDGRKSTLRDAYTDAENAIDRFVERRNDLLARIDDLRTDLMRGLNRPRRLHVPFYVVTVERDGAEETVVVPPSRLTSSDGWFEADLDPLPGLDEPAERLARDPPAASTTRHVDGHELGAVAGKFGRESFAGRLSVGDALADATGDELLVSREGGGN